MSPSEQEPAPPERAVSRRVLLGSGLLVVGAIGGGAAGFVLTDAPREVVPDPVPPADLLAAIAREHDLVATYDAALAAAPNPLWSHLRGEHVEHAAALAALLPAGTSTSAAPSSAAPTASGSATAGSATTGSATTLPTPGPPPPGAAELLAAERSAADAARVACLAGNGTAAVLLACVAASEASHAAVLA